ncbi:hypothetical protein IW254_000324 [Corynebacterium aquatimens]|uniref:Uncharacterized protein n=1 Tax=Corynebacterium aquatimens TaxID=1190508 RepID=A0A931DWF9_9CORY|nr:hypothetical protein [Corynebacterium aquatimens]
MCACVYAKRARMMLALGRAGAVTGCADGPGWSVGGAVTGGG